MKTALSDYERETYLRYADELERTAQRYEGKKSHQNYVRSARERAHELRQIAGETACQRG